MARLDADKVVEIFEKCLIKDDEQVDCPVQVDGVVHSAALHPERLKMFRQEIYELLLELPEAFMETGGGGMSFLQACVDKYGRQWADLHMTMEELFMLGAAIDRVYCLFPRRMWPDLPGGVPYYVVRDKLDGNATTATPVPDSTENAPNSAASAAPV